MPIKIIIPTIPVAFFKIELHPITVSTASPNIFPTTGIKLETAALAVLAVTPSTVLLKVPSTETIPTKSVSTTPNTQTTLVLKNLDNLSTWTLSDILDTTPREVEINTNGIMIPIIKLPINVIKKSIIGCKRFADAILPVVSINVIKIGISEFMNPTRLCIDSFTISKICTKFVIISVTINMY